MVKGDDVQDSVHNSQHRKSNKSQGCTNKWLDNHTRAVGTHNNSTVSNERKETFLAHLSPEQLVCNTMPSLATLITLEAVPHCCYQNPKSKEYYGDLTNGGLARLLALDAAVTSIRGGEVLSGMLQTFLYLLFSCEQNASLVATELLEVVSQRQSVWVRSIRVPKCIALCVPPGNGASIAGM